VLGAGTTRTVHVAVNSAGRRLLTGRGAPHARLLVTATGTNGAASPLLRRTIAFNAE
jgi:hypothetical protein